MSKSAARALPRLILAGLAGDTGKTLVATGLVRALTSRGLRVAAFKKGPDFIDAQWLGQASGGAARNLDTFLMPEEAILSSLVRAALESDIAVVEGNRGLFDGVDAMGSHSTAQLSKLLAAPVVLVMDSTKATRTVAAQVLGCRALDPDVRLAGVILNRIGTARQEAVIREAVTAETGVPVLGAIPRLPVEHLPGRHLGLVTSVEHPAAAETIGRLAERIEKHVDVGALAEMAASAPHLPPLEVAPAPTPIVRARIGVLRDKAFSFYYPENLEALEFSGAELIAISPLADEDLPPIDGLYAGGGFPEVHAEDLTRNGSFREALARRIGEGLPVWAECGGLMYLSRALLLEGVEHPMVGALPVAVEQTSRPQGHGYVKARVDGRNPFLPEGSVVCGHEFHYSRLVGGGGRIETILDLERGVGVGSRRDGIRAGAVVAAYTHLHALGVPDWADSLVRAAVGAVG